MSGDRQWIGTPGARLAAFAWACLYVLACVLPRAAVAQDPERTPRRRAAFDSSRAFLTDSTVFQPFYVRETQPLERALADGRVTGDTPLLVMDHEAGRLALLTDQMAYHHVAQGETAGEPWMVSF